MPDVLLIEPCDFERYPTGGQLSFAKQMIGAFGNRLALVGISTDETAVGRWLSKSYNGVAYDFFSVGHRTPSSGKPLIPARITAYLQMKRYEKEIMSLGIKSAFIQAPEVLIAVSDWGWNSICYCSPGLGNPLNMPRYCWGKLFAGAFFSRWIRALQGVDIILAAADDRLIDTFVICSKGRLAKHKIVKFPTCVDTSLLRPTSKALVRNQLGIGMDSIVIITCGRINLVKGWDLLVNAFNVFCQSKRNAQLIFIGDGEDRKKLKDQIAKFGLSGKVKITGFQPPTEVVKYLNAADLYVVGSHIEGWSVAMLEALACGKPIVSTDISGARDMIAEGGNGYIVEKRDPKCFADAMNSALVLQDAAKISLGIADKYALKNLARDLGMLWKPLG
jgi:glycosyltransferase involved in cell wall biosynthesis